MNSLFTRVWAALSGGVLAGWLLHAGLTCWPIPQLTLLAGWRLTAADHPLVLGLGGLLGVALLAGVAWLLLSPLRQVLRALQVIALSYRDGELSITIADQGKRAPGELRELLHVHAELGRALREQRQHLLQRELLLDTVVQNTPVALVLTDARERVVYTNVAARQMLTEGRSMVGDLLPVLLAKAPEALRDALTSRRDALVSVDEESVHVLQRELQLQGRPHRLLLLRRMTRELGRQEVASWKRVIRVLSHELNNSLAPISSLAHSGAELARRGELARLPAVFSSIGERSRHLHEFLEGYARFAKLPAPQLAPVSLDGFVTGLSAHCRFQLQGSLPSEILRFDAGQIEQALINLLKNAHEAGGDPDAVALSVSGGEGQRQLRFEVRDAGPGMSDSVLAQALLPFYSTKRSGSGLGLAIAREIAEAHGGSLSLANQPEGGLVVSLCLPGPLG
ncbi:MAG: ATP-binding protein [Polyangiales bacterium]